MNNSDLREKKIDGIIKEQIAKVGIRGEVNLKPKPLDLKEYSFDEERIKAREHSVGRAETESFMQNAAVSVRRKNGGKNL